MPNLLIVALTLIIIRSAIIAPSILEEGHTLTLSHLSFLLLCLLTIITTLGGYIINDLYDEETDKRNHVKRQAIGIWMSREKAKAVYLIIHLIGLVLNFYLAYQHNQLLYSWIFPLAVILLWWYAAQLKGTVIWGNLLVSLFCAAVALLLPFAEKSAISKLIDGSDMLNKLYFYALFAGLSNFIREIIKDAEDRLGDEQSGYQTLAVVYGTNASRNLALALSLGLLILILFFPYLSGIQLTTEKVTLLAALLIPFLVAIIMGLMKPKDQINWHRLSLLCKILMLGGLISVLIWS